MGKLQSLLSAAYELSGGSTNFPSIKTYGPAQMVTVEMSDIIAADNEMKLQQSADEVSWQDIADSEVTLDAAQTVQTWNLYGLPKGAFVRVSVTPGATETGSVTQVKVLGDE